MDKIKPTYWMTFESARRLERGGNCKGAVPVHGKPSVTAKIPLYDKSAIDTLRAEVERLQSDAKRYRWFRAGLESNHADAYEIAEFAYRGGLDAAIDAAMQGDA